MFGEDENPHVSDPDLFVHTATEFDGVHFAFRAIIENHSTLKVHE